MDILHLQKTKTEKSSEDMKRQIRHARERQAERFAGTDCRFNGDIRSAQVEEYCPLGEEGQKVMEQLYRTLQLSARVYHRILKTARTIADLEDREEITGESFAGGGVLSTFGDVLELIVCRNRVH